MRAGFPVCVGAHTHCTATGRASDKVSQAGWGRAIRVARSPMFLFFSNRLGCLGSLAVSAAITVLLLIAFNVL